MPRIKAKCQNCDRTILLFFDVVDPDLNEISALETGEMFEHKCPSCDDFTVFEVAEQ